MYLSNYNQPFLQEVFNNQNTRLLDSNVSDEISALNQENLVLKQKIQELEGQVLQTNKNIIQETKDIKQANQEENSSTELQVYENKNLEVYQQDSPPLKTKRGIFGTKYVEDKPKKK